MRSGCTFLKAQCYKIQGRNSLVNLIILDSLKYKVTRRILFFNIICCDRSFIRNLVMFSSITQSMCSLYLSNKRLLLKIYKTNKY